MRGRISEIFHSVQGEGLYLGEKQLFVRLFGCNLSCKFCDTKLDRFMEYEPHEVLEELKLYEDFHSVSFTGGEPLLQKEFLKETLELSSAHGFKNYLETNGTLAGELKEVIDFVDIVAMDLKLPSSTDMGSFWSMHRSFLEVASKKEVFVKMIICKSTQEKCLREALRMIKEVNRSAMAILQPNSFELDEELVGKLQAFRDVCFEEGITACVIPQMHKAAGIR
jgi:organic radical activating enzyme